MTCDPKLLSKEEMDEATYQSTSGDSAQHDWLETWRVPIFGHIAALEHEAAKVPELVRVAEAHGWNGVDNTKHLATFLEDELAALAKLRAQQLPATPEEVARDVETVKNHLVEVKQDQDFATSMAALSRLAAQAARVPGLVEEVDKAREKLARYCGRPGAGANTLEELVDGAVRRGNAAQDERDAAESERDAVRRESEGATRELEAIREALDDAGIPKATEEQCQGDRVDVLAKRADELVKAVSEARAFVTSLHGAAGCNAMHSHLVPEVGCARDNIFRLRNRADTAEARVRELTTALESALVQWSGDRSLCTRCRTAQPQVLSPRVPHKHAKGCPLAVAPQNTQAQASNMREAATVLEAVVKEVADAAELEAEAEEERSGDEESPVAARERGIVEGAREVLKRYRAALASQPPPAPDEEPVKCKDCGVEDGDGGHVVNPCHSCKLEVCGDCTDCTTPDNVRVCEDCFARGNYGQPPPAPAQGVDRERLGQEVRAEWVAWAKEQPNPKPSWLVPWEGLSEPDKEADRRIGERLYRLASTTPTPPPGLLEAVVEKYAEEQTRRSSEADAKSERDGDSHCLEACNREGRAAGAREVLPLILAAYDAAKGGEHPDTAALRDLRADVARVLEMARLGVHVGDTATEVGEEAVQAVRALHEDAEAWRRTHRLLEDSRAVEGVYWDALREADPTLDLDGKARTAVEEALAKAIRWALNIDGASDGDDPADEDEDDDTPPSGPGEGERVNACGFVPTSAEDVAAFGEIVQATARHMETRIAPTPTPEVPQRRSAEDIMWSIVAPHAQPTSPPLDLREAVGQLLAQRAKDDEWSTLNLSDAFRTRLTTLRAAYDAAMGREHPVQGEDSTLVWNVLARSPGAPDYNTAFAALVRISEDAAKYRAAVERLDDRTGKAKAAHDAWGSDPDGAVARWVLYGDGEAPAPRETLDKARVVEVLLAAEEHCNPLSDQNPPTEPYGDGYLDALHQYKEEVATRLGLDLDTPPSGPGGGETTSRDDVLNAFSVEEDPAGALERYQREHPALAQDLAALAHELAQPLAEQTGPLPAEDEALINKAWTQHAAIKPASRARIAPTPTPKVPPMARVSRAHGGHMGPKAVHDAIAYAPPPMQRDASRALYSLAADYTNLRTTCAAESLARDVSLPEPSTPEVMWEGDGLRMLSNGTVEFEDEPGQWRAPHEWLRVPVEHLTAIARALAEAKRETAHAQDLIDVAGHATVKAVRRATELGAEDMRERMAHVAENVGLKNLASVIRAAPLLGKAVRRG